MAEDVNICYTLRNNIKYHLVNREIEMTQKELAEKAGLDPSYLDMIIDGKISSLSALEAILIAKALEEDVEDIFVLAVTR